MLMAMLWRQLPIIGAKQDAYLSSAVKGGDSDDYFA